MHFFFDERPFFKGDHVADVIGADIVGEAFEFLDDHPSDHFFIARRAGGFTDAGKERDVDRHGADKLSHTAG